jgi:hypothetical protein
VLLMVIARWLGCRDYMEDVEELRLLLREEQRRREEAESRALEEQNRREEECDS